MLSTDVGLPIQVCRPRSFAIEPSFGRSQAVTRAGSRSSSVFSTFGISLRGRPEVEVELVQRRLVPFWHAHCSSRFHYDRLSNYALAPNHSDAVEITIKGPDEGQLSFPLDLEAKARQVAVQGTERCITERDVSELIDGVKAPDSGTERAQSVTERARAVAERARSVFQREQTRLGAYLTGSSRQIDDLVSFYQTGTLGGEPLYSDLADEGVEIVLPAVVANRVVRDVVKKVMVSIDPTTIHDWALTVEVADLYFRPLYIFQFDRLDSTGNVTATKLEQLDAVQGEWAAISSLDVSEPSIALDRVLELNIDASVVVLEELGPWLNATSVQ